VSGPDGSSTKRNPPGAARVPGPSYLRVYRPEVNIQRQVHGLKYQNRLLNDGGGFVLYLTGNHYYMAKLIKSGAKSQESEWFCCEAKRRNWG